MATRFEQAKAKFEKSLTPNQQKLIREMVLAEAVASAEANIEKSGKYRVMPHWSLRSNASQKSINIAVWNHHIKCNSLWGVDENGRTTMLPVNSL